MVLIAHLELQQVEPAEQGAKSATQGGKQTDFPFFFCMQVWGYGWG